MQEEGRSEQQMAGETTPSRADIAEAASGEASASGSNMRYVALDG
jgi:hypothetical protein